MRLIDADELSKVKFHPLPYTHIIPPVLSAQAEAYERGWNDAIDAIIENAETIVPQRWIPVTERLPEEADGTVLVCMPDIFPYNAREQYVNAKHNQQVETAKYSQYSDRYSTGDYAVTAWMPLPDPWKGESDG